jgi:hypothetical protein
MDAMASSPIPQPSPHQPSRFAGVTLEADDL